MDDASRARVWSNQSVDTLGVEPRAFRMRSGCDTTTPCARWRPVGAMRANSLAIAVAHFVWAAPRGIVRARLRVCNFKARISLSQVC